MEKIIYAAVYFLPYNVFLISILAFKNIFHRTLKIIKGEDYYFKTNYE